MSASWRPRALPDPPNDAHKGSVGRVLAVCGSATMPGAAILVLRACYRAGAGLVTLGCLDRALLAVVPGAVPEAVYVDLAHEEQPARRLAEREDHARIAGPGLGTGERARVWVDALVAESGTPLVLDADALNLLAGEPERLAGRRGPTIITPHPGEAARLGGERVPSGDEGRIACARALAHRARAICCLKGARTVVTDGERVWINDTGNSGMATAGTGDVLAGALAAALAAWSAGLPDGWTPFELAATTVRVHGRAGDLAAARRGRRAVIASDLIDELGPAAMVLGEGAPSPW